MQKPLPVGALVKCDKTSVNLLQQWRQRRGPGGRDRTRGAHARVDAITCILYIGKGELLHHTLAHHCKCCQHKPPHNSQGFFWLRPTAGSFFIFPTESELSSGASEPRNRPTASREASNCGMEGEPRPSKSGRAAAASSDQLFRRDGSTRALSYLAALGGTVALSRDAHQDSTAKESGLLPGSQQQQRHRSTNGAKQVVPDSSAGCPSSKYEHSHPPILHGEGLQARLNLAQTDIEHKHVAVSAGTLDAPSPPRPESAHAIVTDGETLAPTSQPHLRHFAADADASEAHGSTADALLDAACKQEVLTSATPAHQLRAAVMTGHGCTETEDSDEVRSIKPAPRLG